MKLILLSVILFLCSAYGQGIPPQWLNESWRNVNYPSNEWYVGFTQNTLTNKSNTAEALKQLEREAQNKLAESITVRISGVSSVNETNLQTQNNGKTQTQSSSGYRQNINASTNAELTKMNIRSFYDERSNYIYAFAVVKKSDLANYYASQIEFALSEVEREIQLSKQLLEHNKKKEVFEKLGKSKKIIDSTAYYRELLVAVDTKNGIARSQGARINKLLNEIALVQNNAKSKTEEMVIFVFGNDGGVVSGLQAILSENDVAITENEKEAAYILKIDAKVCNERFDGRFHYANACVKASLTNVKTGKNEALITSNGQKGGGLNAKRAEEEAFKLAATDIWTKIREKIENN